MRAEKSKYTLKYTGKEAVRRQHTTTATFLLSDYPYNKAPFLAKLIPSPTLCFIKKCTCFIIARGCLGFYLFKTFGSVNLMKRKCKGELKLFSI